MTYESLVEEVKQLSRQEQAQLRDVLTQALKAAARPPERKMVSAKEMRGILKPNGFIPSDQELKEDYINYLEEKYR